MTFLSLYNRAVVTLSLTVEPVLGCHTRFPYWEGVLPQVQHEEGERTERGGGGSRGGEEWKGRHLGICRGDSWLMD